MENESKKTKESTCYGCGQPLRKYSLLICSECLDSECENFVSFFDEEEEIKIEDIA